jgi:hypothetical protein
MAAVRASCRVRRANPGAAGGNAPHTARISRSQLGLGGPPAQPTQAALSAAAEAAGGAA